MKKLFLFSILIFITGTIFAHGNIYFSNVCHTQGLKDFIRFKIVIKDAGNHIIKELYTQEIPPQTDAVILRDQIGITEGSINYYIENVTKKTGFQECITDFGYHISYFTRIGGWYNNQQKYGCNLMED